MIFWYRVSLGRRYRRAGITSIRLVGRLEGELFYALPALYLPRRIRVKTTDFYIRPEK